MTLAANVTFLHKAHKSGIFNAQFIQGARSLPRHRNAIAKDTPSF
jgi:hypothetical protein